jgi:hypothetical protein
VSVYGSFCTFDVDEPDRRAPMLYRGSHVLPSMDDTRGGSFDLGLIPGHITRDGHDDGDEDGAVWPFLRVGMRGSEEEPDTLVFDVEQVEQLHADLGWWLAHVDRRAR